MKATIFDAAGEPLRLRALAEPVAAGLHAVSRAGLRPGAQVLVLRAGPIGMTVTFWARRLGAGAVIVAGLNRYQEERAAAMGATGFAISGPGLAEAFARLAGGPPGRRLRVRGKRGLIDLAVSLVRVHGIMVGVGLRVGGDAWDPFAALSKEVTIAMSAFFDMHEFATDALGPGQFRPQALVTDRIDLGRVPETFEALRQRTTQCKVLVQADAA